MISSSNRISRREEVNELFQQLGQTLEQKVEALLIGGAVMLELGLKDATKDIDIVCRSEEDKEALLASAKALGFQIVGPEKRHERLGVNRLAVKGGRNLDIFAERISYDFGLSDAMWQRATKIRSFGNLIIREASIEDIFIMKMIANRAGRRTGLLQACPCRTGLRYHLPGDRGAVPKVRRGGAEDLGHLYRGRHSAAGG